LTVKYFWLIVAPVMMYIKGGVLLEVIRSDEPTLFSLISSFLFFLLFLILFLGSAIPMLKQRLNNNLREEDIQEISEPDSKLIDTLELLSGKWSIEDYQLAGRGWMAVIAKDDSYFTLHSNRGSVDIHPGPNADLLELGSKTEPKDIAELIEANITSRT